MMRTSAIAIDNFDAAVANDCKLKFTTAMQKDTTDEQLILKYAQGHSQAFEVLYSRHKNSLMRYCLRQFSSRAMAEECFQEIWMKVIKNRSRYQPKALFTTYLYRIATNHVIDIYRKEKKRNHDCEYEEDKVAEDFHLAAEKIENQVNKALVEKLREQIALLPFEQRNTLLLKLNEGLSLDDISEIMNCGKETVKSRLRYATKKLKEALGNSFGAN